MYTLLYTVLYCTVLYRSLLWETDQLGGVEVRTVDGYQGREKEAIILSLVR